MIRKQVYLEREQERRLKALASLRGCTEAQIIREALDQLPDPTGSITEQLAAAGLLASKGDMSDVPSGAALDVLEAEVESWLESLPRPLRLTEAVQSDRNDR